MFTIRFTAGRLRPDYARCNSDVECAAIIKGIMSRYYGQPLRIVASQAGAVVFTHEVR